MWCVLYAGLSLQAWEILKPYQEENNQKRETGGSRVLSGAEASLGRCSWRSATGVWFQKAKVRKAEKGKIYP